MNTSEHLFPVACFSYTLYFTIGEITRFVSDEHLSTVNSFSGLIFYTKKTLPFSEHSNFPLTVNLHILPDYTFVMVRLECNALFVSPIVVVSGSFTIGDCMLTKT